MAEQKTYLLRVRVTHTATVEIVADTEAAAVDAFEQGRFDDRALQLDEMVDWDVGHVKELD